MIEHFRQGAREESLSEIEKVSPLAHSAPNQFDELLLKEKGDLVRQVIMELQSDRDRQTLLRFYIAAEEKERIFADLGLTGLHFNRVLFRARERYRSQPSG